MLKSPLSFSLQNRSKPTIFCAVALVVGVLAPVLPAHAQNPPPQNQMAATPVIDGTLDATFVGNNESIGNNGNLNDGRFVTKFTIDGESVQSRVNEVLLQSDNKIIAIGSAGNQFALARYNTNGTLDTTFGTGGKVTTSFGRSEDGAYSGVIDGDGKIVVGGEKGALDRDFALARYNTDGTLDTSFGENGKVTTKVRRGSVRESVRKLLLLSDGKLLAGGFSNNDPVIIRYNADGSVDNSFGSDGRIILTAFSNTESVSGLIELSDKKIIVGALARGNIALLRLNANGTLDTTFGDQGIVWWGGVVSQRLWALHELEGEKFVAVGNDGQDMLAVQFANDGTLDTTFGESGAIRIDAGAADTAFGVDVQKDGKIVVAGHTHRPNDSNVFLTGRLALARINTDGTLDDTFGSEGVLVAPVSEGPSAAFSLIVQPDGKIVAAGRASNNFALARFASSPPGTTKPTLTLSLDTASPVPESVGNVTVRATLSQGAPSGGLRVTLRSLQGSTTTAADDFTFPSPFTIASGQSVTTATLSILDDDIDEDDETLKLGAIAGIANVVGTSLKITDNDVSGVVISKSAINVDVGGTNDYTVKLRSRPTANVVITATSGTPANATLSPKTLTFTATDWNTTQTMTVSGKAEGTSEITHKATSSDTSYLSELPGGVEGLSIDSVDVTVKKPTPSELTLSLSSLSVLENVGTAKVTATLDHPALADTTVTFTATTGTATVGTDLTVPATFTATIAKDAKSASANITIVDDKIDESDETFTLGATAASLSASTVTVTILDDDPAGVTVTPLSLSVDIGSTKNYTVVLDNPPSADVTITATSGSTGVAGVAPRSRTFTTSNWDTAQSFTVSGVATGTATISHTATSADGDYSGLTVDKVKVTVTNPPPSSLSVSLTDTTVAEDAGDVTVTATFDQPVKAATTVTFTASGGTATGGGVDYSVSATFTAAFTVGQTAGTATVTIEDDDLDETDETLKLGASGGGLTAAAVTMTITDNDTAGVTVSEDTLTIAKGSTKTYTVVLDTKPGSQVIVTPTSGTPGVATFAPSARTFNSNFWKTPQTFTVTGAETGTSTITHAASSTDDNYGSTLDIDSVDVTVENPDPSTLKVSLTDTTVAEDAGDVTVTATFDQPVKTATTVTFTASGGTATGGGVDYSVSATFTAAFTVGQTAGTATVTIEDDDLDEADETFQLAASGGGLTADAVTVTIQDNDTAGVTVSEDTLTIAKGSTKTYTVVLDTKPGSQVIVTPTSGTPGVATFAPSARTFNSNFWKTPQTFTVTGAETGTSTITHAASSTDDNYGSTLDIDSVDVTVENPDPSTLKVSLTDTTVAEDAGDVTVTATFDQPVKTATTVTFTASGGTATGGGVDYSVPATFTAAFTVGQTAGTATVTIEDDDLDEADETFQLAASGGGLTADAVTVTIQDNDTAGVTVSEDTLTIAKGSTKTYTVVLDTKPGSQVIVTPTSGTPGVATFAPSARTFNSNFWKTPQTFTVTGAETGTSTISHAASSTDTNYGSTLDIDSVDVTVENPDPSTLKVSLTDTTVAEDAGDVTVTATFDQPVKTATTVTFTATAGTATGGGVDYKIPATFTATVAKGATAGTSSVTVTDDSLDETDETLKLGASGGGLTASAVTMTITDNDTAGIEVSPTTLKIFEGAKKTYKIVLRTQPTSTVVVAASSSALGKARVSPTTLFFSTSNWSTAQTVTVSGISVGVSTISHTAGSVDNNYHNATIDNVVATVEKPPPSKLTVSLANTTVAEDAGDVTVTATFDQPVKAATTVTFTATAGTATGGGADYSVPNTFTGIAAKGQSTATATVTIVNDDLDETNETFTVAASAGTLTAAAVTVTITDDDTAGVTVSEDALTVVKGQKKTYTVVLDTQPTSQVVVTPTSGTTAVATVAPTARTFTTSDWGTAQTFTVTGVTSGTSNITHAASSTDDDYGESLSVDDVDVTVENPDPSTLTVSLTNTTVAETAGDVTVTATFDQPVKAATTVTFTATAGTATGGGADYSVPNTFTGIAAKGQSTATAIVTIVNDDLDETNETFDLKASAGSIESAAVTVTIQDDDTAGVTVSEDTLTVVKGQKKTYTVVLDTQPTSQVVVTPTSGTTAVATVAPTARTFTTSDWGTAQTFTVTGVTSGTSNITHAASSTDDDYGESLSVDDVDVTVENPDPTTLTVSLTNTTVAENVGDVTVTATFDQPVKAATTVTFTATAGTATGGGADYSVPNTFTGVAAKGQSTATATVTIEDDDLDETNETFTLKAAAGSIESAAVTVTIQDDDTAGVTVSEDTLTVVKGQKKTYTIVLDTQPTSQVVLTPTSGTTAVATVAPTARTFTTSDWGTAQTFTVTGKTSGTSTVTHAASSTDDNYGSSRTIDSVEVTVENPDPSTLTVSLTNTTVAETAGDVTVTATFDQPVKAATTVTFTATAGTATGGGADYSVPNTFTGIAAKGQSTATATVTIVNDDLDETNETFALKAAAGSIESAAVTVTIQDDDTAGVTVSEDALTVVKGQKKTYTVVLDTQPTSQVTITPTSGTTAVATVAPTARTFTTSDWGTAQTFTVTGVTSGTSNITHAASSTDDNYGESLSVDDVDVTVENPDPTTLTVSLTNTTVAENVGDITVTATFDQPVKAATTVTFTATAGTATGGADFTVPATFTGIAAKGQSTATATVTIEDDDLDETDEKFSLAASAGTLTAAAVTVTITDDDTAGVTVSEDALTITKGQKKTYTIVLDSEPTSQVVVTPTSGTTAVATVAPTARTFTTSDWGTAQTFTVTGVTSGTSNITHAASSTDDDYGESLSVDDVDVTVENPDPSTLTVSLTNTTVAETAGDVTVTATFDQPVKAATTVTFTATAGTATGGGADYSVPNTFTGVAAKGQSTATAIVTIVNDDLDETDETFALKAAAGSIESAAVTVTIQDDDTAGVTVSEDALAVVKGQKKTYTIVLDTQPTSQVVLTPTSGTTAVATVAPTARTFTTSDWGTAQTFTVTGVTSGTSNITHAASSTDDDYGESLSVDDVDVTVENPDPSTLTVSLTNTTVAENVGDVTVTATFESASEGGDDGDVHRDGGHRHRRRRRLQRARHVHRRRRERPEHRHRHSHHRQRRPRRNRRKVLVGRVGGDSHRRGGDRDDHR